MFVLRILVVSYLASGNAQFGSASAQGVIWLDSTDAHVGAISDYDQALHALRQLGALPNGSDPIVVSVHSVDSQNAYMAGYIAGAQEIVSKETVSLGGGTPVLVLTPWGRPHEVAERGGRFPTSPEELVAVGFGDVAALESVDVVWDPTAAFPEVVAARSFAFGAERLNGIHMFICATNDEVLGWARARAYRGHRVATHDTVGRFTRDCLQGQIAMPREYKLPQAARQALGVEESWFAVLLPDAYSQPVALEATMASAHEILAMASVDIPIFVEVVDTASADWLEFIPASQHATDLSVYGVMADERVSASLPDWIGDFATHNTTTLVLFDASGTAVAHFGASPTNPTGRTTLIEVLMTQGLF